MSDEAQALPPGDVAPAADPVPNAVPAAVEPTAEPASAPSVDGAATTSPSAASSPAEPTRLLTFEERVEARFLTLEGYLAKLPHSIAHAFSLGSAEPEELATRALAHLFTAQPEELAMRSFAHLFGTE